MKPATETITPLSSHPRCKPLHLVGVALPIIGDLSHIDVLEFVFALVRYQEEIGKPSWTGFNKLTRNVYL